MTRSAVSEHSPRVVRKAFRAQARSQGLTYPQAITAAKARAAAAGAGAKPEGTPVNGGRRNPGRMDGVQWNGDSFVCTRNIDGDAIRSYQTQELEAWDAADELDDRGAEQFSTEQEYGRHMVSLLDIARPAKRKGVAKKYEVIPTVRRIVDLETASVGESELWEQWDAASEMESEQWEQWESQSEAWEDQGESAWEVPARDYTAAEWEKLYAETVEKTASRSYSAAVNGGQR